jgi:hypothetical protein
MCVEEGKKPLVRRVPCWVTHFLEGSQINLSKLVLPVQTPSACLLKRKAEDNKGIDTCIWDIFRRKLLKIEQVEACWASLTVARMVRNSDKQ